MVLPYRMLAGKPFSKSAARWACAAAVKIARLSSFRTLSHEAIGADKKARIRRPPSLPYDLVSDFPFPRRHFAAIDGQPHGVLPIFDMHQMLQFSAWHLVPIINIDQLDGAEIAALGI